MKNVVLIGASGFVGSAILNKALNPGWGNPRQYEETLENYPKIVEGAEVCLNCCFIAK